MSQVYFSFDVVKLRVSPDEHHFYTGYKYNDAPLFRTFDEAKTKAIEVAKTDFKATEQTVRPLEDATIQTLIASDTASFSLFLTYFDNLGTKTDVILTVRALAADSETSTSFYTYHLANLSVPAMPLPRRMYEIINVKHGPMYANYETAKSAILKMCEDMRYLKLYEQSWSMSKDVTNIGKWKKGFKEDFTGFDGLQELRLDVFRLQLGI